MVYRIYVEKKQNLAVEASGLYDELKNTLGIGGLTRIRVINRYDAMNIDKAMFDSCINGVFAEPQVDDVYNELPSDDAKVFAVEYLAGQFDQRADSAEQCIQIISQQERPIIRTAKVYMLYGDISAQELIAVKKYLINPVECKEASLEKQDTLIVEYSQPTTVAIIDGFTTMNTNQLKDFIKSYGLAMDSDDIAFCQKYFISKDRQPTITEIRMIDTYWSDHCRHTTFSTIIDKAEFKSAVVQKAFDEYLKQREFLSRKKPITLMDIATISAKAHKKSGKLPLIDESEEINACTVKIKVDVGGEQEDWLLLFKNETHNHPTEIEPFGGSATCIGGAIRDPLSGRSYVYSAMRITGSGNPLTPLNETLKGKLPQRKIATTSANGYSSYGNQIGLATGIVDEIYHDGYVAKHMELGAVVGATPAKNVVRLEPKDGDIVIMLGGKTGRDGCGGATGSSKSHTQESLATCGAEVQKGNAPEERKLQRLFRNPNATKLIKRCNDFGAGGVSVAVGELADGLYINLDAVPKKYEGLDGTELAISESQERMAIIVDKNNVDKMLAYAGQENIMATIIARVTAEPRLIMEWKGNRIVDLDREFLNSNGAEKHITVTVEETKPFSKDIPTDFIQGYFDLCQDINVCNKRGLVERFDSTIGSNTLLMPLGGKYQATPIQAIANKICVEHHNTDTCSLMAWGYNPFIAECSPYHSAYLSVIESVSKLIATGASFDQVYLTCQEFFEKLGKDSSKWGKPMSALLGANKAQIDLGISAIGGKDSMSGSFEHINVPPTLITFAVTVDNVANIISPEFKGANHKVVWLKPTYDSEGLPTADSLIANYNIVHELVISGKALAVYTPTYGGVAESIFKMSIGNHVGFNYSENISAQDIFGYSYGSFVIEISNNDNIGMTLGYTTERYAISYGKDTIAMAGLESAYDGKLADIYPVGTHSQTKVEPISYNCNIKQKSTYSFAKPRVLIPTFPGTNCECDTAKSFELAGAETDIFVIKNLCGKDIMYSVDEFTRRLKQSQILFLPGGFSGGDEPDGSAKFITAFIRNSKVSQELMEFLKHRDGLACGICNGFQALIKLGLLPYGKIITPTADSPTLTYNEIHRHQSRIVRVRVASDKSPWFNRVRVGEVFNVPISHGEGRFIANDKILGELVANGQVATQYVDLKGNPTMDVDYNPNGSLLAIEGITSPDGRILGKMGHSERIGKDLYKNVEGNYDMQILLSAIEYFK